MKPPERKFHVIHFSTSMKGGAGIAARRLHEALLANQVDSYLISLNADSQSKQQIIVKRSNSMVIKSKIFTYFNLKYGAMSFFSIFTTGLSFRKIVSMIMPVEFEERTAIIHIHNWYNLVSIKVIKKISELGFPIVLTLHDERLLTGGCHYALSCVGFHSGCISCPEVNWIAKWQIRKNAKLSRELFARHPKIFVIAPSQWIYGEILQSRQTHLTKVFQIYNVVQQNKSIIDTKRILSPSVAGSELTTKFIGVASLDKDSLIKGGDITQELMQIFEGSTKDVRIIFLSEWLSGGNSFDSFWSEISAVLVLSRADNSPNVIHEAKIYNVPVIATSVGGIPELLNRDYDLVLHDLSIPVNDLSDQIISFVRNQSHRPSSDGILSSYTRLIGSPVKEHIELYESIANACF